jgi:hypothetical protein
VRGTINFLTGPAYLETGYWATLLPLLQNGLDSVCHHGKAIISPSSTTSQAGVPLGRAMITKRTLLWYVNLNLRLDLELVGLLPKATATQNTTGEP